MYVQNYIQNTDVSKTQFTLFGIIYSNIDYIYPLTGFILYAYPTSTSIFNGINIYMYKSISELSISFVLIDIPWSLLYMLYEYVAVKNSIMLQINRCSLFRYLENLAKI